jgi:hypothetical protein
MSSNRNVLNPIASLFEYLTLGTMGLFVSCCRIPPPLNPEAQEQDHSLIANSSGQAEIKQIIEHNRHAPRITALLEGSSRPFKATALEPSESSSIEEDLKRMMPSPSPPVRPDKPSDDDSEDEGGIAGEMDSTDST